MVKKNLITLLFQHECSKLFLYVNFSVWTLKLIYVTLEHEFCCCICYMNLKRIKLVCWVIHSPRVNNFLLLIKIYICTFQIYFKYSLKYIWHISVYYKLYLKYMLKIFMEIFWLHFLTKHEIINFWTSQPYPVASCILYMFIIDLGFSRTLFH